MKKHKSGHRTERMTGHRLMQAAAGLVLVALMVADSPAATQEDGTRTNYASALVCYEVGKAVSVFPTNEDLSTPERAYATIHRAWAAEGDAAWRRLSAPELAGRIGSGKRQPLPGRQAERLLSAEIVEVRMFQETNAAVFARMATGKETGVDIRWLEKRDGRWLNRGNDVMGRLEEARNRFEQFCDRLAIQQRLAARPAIADPDAHLKPFVEFLKQEGRKPEELLTAALKRHRLVIVGEVHHRPRYWQLNSQLIQSPEFAAVAGTIYLELPMNGQPLVDEFLATKQYEPARVVEVLRDMLWMGWPDGSMLDFFRAVWETNRALPDGRKLRIVLVDMARPWMKITKPGDWRAYEVDRDDCMAKAILRDLRTHTNDLRHGLFIVGYGHAGKSIHQPGGMPAKTAGWHLNQALGETNVYCVFPHSPVMSNNGQTGGRIALGLIDSALEAISNKPVAFPLDHGPFGELVFDASMELLTSDPFRSGFDGYLYLGALESEVMSPVIDGFYTDEFARELDRRSRASFGRGLEAHGIEKVDGVSFEAWMKSSWGQPREEWSLGHLGPTDAWKLGGDWKARKAAAILSELRAKGAETGNNASLREELRRRVEEFFRQNHRDITERKTLEWAEFGRLTNGKAAIHYRYTATIWGKATIKKDQVFVFGPQGEFVSLWEVKE